MYLVILSKELYLISGKGSKQVTYKQLLLFVTGSLVLKKFFFFFFLTETFSASIFYEIKNL